MVERHGRNLKREAETGEEQEPQNYFHRLFSNFRKKILVAIKYRFPAFWRKNWGYPLPEGTRFEDYCENLKPVKLKKDVLGREGERIVFEAIRKDPGNRVLACNTENYYCEIDIVFLDERTREIVFVEVKTRRRDALYTPEEYSIDNKRRKKLALAARTFRDERGYWDYKERFDVAVVIKPHQGEPTIRYSKAFFTYLDAFAGYYGKDYGKTRSEKYLRADIREWLESGNKQRPKDR